MENQNKASDAIQDDDEVKEIELLTKDLELTEDARTTIVSNQDDSDSTLSNQNDSGSTVSNQDDSSLTVSNQDGSFAIMTAKREFYLFETELQKIAEESKDSTFEKIHAGLSSEAMIARLKRKEIYEQRIVIALNSVEISNILMNKDLMRKFEELFVAIVSVLQYVKSAGTSHLSLKKQQEVFMNLMVVRQEIRHRIKYVIRIQSYYENLLQLFDKMGILVNFPRIKSAIVLSKRIRTFIIEIKLFLEELEEYEGHASTIIERLKDELLTKMKFRN